MKSSKMMNFVFCISAVLVVVFDQYTKYWIKNNIPYLGSMRVIPNFFYLTHVKNSGAAFGLFQQGTGILIIISIIAIILIIIIKVILKFESYFFNISLGLILGGASGNLIDRYFIGEVTDFLHFLRFPVFNIADSSIVVGFIMVMILLIKEFNRNSEKQKN